MSGALHAVVPAVTVRLAVAVTAVVASGAAAELVAVPAPIPRARPPCVTVATLLLELAHVIVGPITGWPAASRAVAANCSVAPAPSVPDDGVTPTELTVTTPPPPPLPPTVTVADPDCPPPVATID